MDEADEDFLDPNLHYMMDDRWEGPGPLTSEKLPIVTHVSLTG